MAVQGKLSTATVNPRPFSCPEIPCWQSVCQRLTLPCVCKACAGQAVCDRTLLPSADGGLSQTQGPLGIYAATWPLAQKPSIPYLWNMASLVSAYSRRLAALGASVLLVSTALAQSYPIRIQKAESAPHYGQKVEHPEVIIERNLQTPLWHVFDPMKAPDAFLEPQGESAEMPLPEGINEALRQKIDARREASIRGRGLYNQDPTPKSDIAPEQLEGFETGGGGGTPNDNHVAVGKDGTFVSVMNTVIRVWSPDGGLKKAWSLINYSKVNPNIDDIPTLTRVYDPRVIYDPEADRWMIIYMHGTTDISSFIVVGYSSSSDPTQPWNVYKIDGSPTADTAWSDYPIVSQTSKDLFFTVNLLLNGTSWEEGFREAVIWQMNKADGYAGKTLNQNLFRGIKYEGVSIWSICAIQNGPEPSGTDNYFMSVRPYSERNDTVFLHRITNSWESGQAEYELQVLRSDLEYGFPPSALQPQSGFKLRTNDARVLSGVRTGKQIHYGQNCMNFQSQQAHLLHGVIYGLDESPFIQARLITHDSLEFGYPAFAAAGDSDEDPSVALSVVYSSAWHYPGAGFLYCNRTGEYSDFTVLRQGESIINYTYIAPDEQRWGDYEGLQMQFGNRREFYSVGSYGKNNQMLAYVARVKLHDAQLDQAIAEIRVFPVPSQDRSVQIEIKADKPGSYQAWLVNALGQSWKSESLALMELDLPAGIHRYRLNTENLSSGVYTLQIEGPDGFKHSQKIVLE